MGTDQGPKTDRSDSPVVGRDSVTRSVSSSMLQRLKERDNQAWQRLFRLFSPVVYHWCRQLRLQPSDAADVLQEVFEAVAEHLPDFRRDRPTDTFRGWLWTITRNKLRDHVRRQRFQPHAVGGTDAQTQWLQLPDVNLEEVEEQMGIDSRSLVARGVLDIIRNDFDERTWEAFWRMTVDGHSSAEIAADLGMNQDAVRQAKARVLRRAREELQGLL